MLEDILKERVITHPDVRAISTSPQFRTFVRILRDQESRMRLKCSRASSTSASLRGSVHDDVVSDRSSVTSKNSRVRSHQGSSYHSRASESIASSALSLSEYAATSCSSLPPIPLAHTRQAFRPHKRAFALNVHHWSPPTQQQSPDWTYGSSVAESTSTSGISRDRLTPLLKNIVRPDSHGLMINVFKRIPDNEKLLFVSVLHSLNDAFGSRWSSAVPSRLHASELMGPAGCSTQRSASTASGRSCKAATIGKCHPGHYRPQRPTAVADLLSGISL
jgi:hypothetical protein